MDKLSGDMPLPITWETFRSMYWIQAFLKAAIVTYGGRLTVDMELFNSILDQSTEMELYFDKSGDADVSCVIIRGDSTTN